MKNVFIVCCSTILLTSGIAMLNGTGFPWRLDKNSDLNNSGSAPNTVSTNTTDSSDREKKGRASVGKFYGVTAGGSESSSAKAVLFSFDPATSTYVNLMNFNKYDGTIPRGSLVQTPNGKLYGMTFAGGKYDKGVLFSFDPAAKTYTVLKAFDGSDGRNPHGSLILASNGKLYGMTYGGGANDAGVIFSFDPVSSTFTKLKDFNKTDGSYPVSSLMQAKDGKLYGMTASHSSSVIEVIFSFDIATNAYTVLKKFEASDGRLPLGGLMQASDGKLYGMTSGLNMIKPTIFSFDPITTTLTKLKELDRLDGRTPRGNLVQAADGKLYGMTSAGGKTDVSENGVIFSLDPVTAIYTKLKSFDYADGYSPYGSLMLASDGKLYGMTNQGGSNDPLNAAYGTIFSFDPATATFTKLKTFDGLNGGKPEGNLIESSLK